MGLGFLLDKILKEVPIAVRYGYWEETALLMMSKRNGDESPQGSQAK